MRALRYSLLGAGLMLQIAACADMSRLPYTEADAGLAEGGVPPALIASCRECIATEGAPCQSSFQQCTLESGCREFMLCVLELGCLAEGALQDRIVCADPCMKQFDVLSGVDPAIQEGLALNACTLPGGPCAAACIAPPP